MDDGADFVACGHLGRLRFQPSRANPADPIKCLWARRERRHPKASEPLIASCRPWHIREQYRPTAAVCCPCV